MSPGREMHHFLMLTPDEQTEAIRRMRGQGWSDHGIAAATRLSVEFIRRVIAQSQEAQA